MQWISQVYRLSVVCLLTRFSVSVLGVGFVSTVDVELWINCLMHVLFICFNGVECVNIIEEYNSVCHPGN